MTYYGRWTYKFEEAARQGAKGCLVINETKAAGYPFAVLQSDFNTTRLQLDERGKDAANCEIIGWITDEIATTVITAAGMDASETIASADKKGFKAIPLSMHASTKMTVQAEYNVSKNVIGQIKGSKYPDETIIYTA